MSSLRIVAQTDEENSARRKMNHHTKTQAKANRAQFQVAEQESRNMRGQRTKTSSARRRRAHPKYSAQMLRTLEGPLEHVARTRAVTKRVRHVFREDAVGGERWSGETTADKTRRGRGRSGARLPPYGRRTRSQILFCRHGRMYPTRFGFRSPSAASPLLSFSRSPCLSSSSSPTPTRHPTKGPAQDAARSS